MDERIFDDEFISSLPDDDIQAWCAIYEKCNPFIKERRNIGVNEQHKYALEINGFLSSMKEIRPIGVDMPKPSFKDKASDINSTLGVLSRINILTKGILEERIVRENYFRTLDYYATKIPGGLSYEFLESDFTRIQELITEIRTLTVESKHIEANHKRRLLKRIEKLQQELNKRMSNFDVFWGFLPEAGLSLGKFGENVKPLTDRICEILRIVMSTQSRAEELPPAKEKPLLNAVDKFSEMQKNN